MRGPSRAISLALIVSLLVAAGCAARQAPPQPKGAPGGGGGGGAIEVVEPQVADVPANYEWPEVFKFAKVVTVLAPETKTRMGDEASQQFYNGFNEYFFGSTSPFKCVDAAALEQAAKELAAVSGATPSQEALGKLADEHADFAVSMDMPKWREQPRPPGGPNKAIGLDLQATGHFLLKGGKSKGANKWEGTADNAQPASDDQKPDLKLKLAAVMGKVLAKKALLNLINTNTAKQVQEVTFLFKRFDPQARDELKECVKRVQGIDKVDDTKGNAPSIPDYRVVVMTRRDLGEIKDEISNELQGINMRFVAAASAGSIVITKK